jgi:oligopeptidase B
MRTNNNLLIMDMKMGTGHAGASGRFEHLKETALEWAFVMKVVAHLEEDV